MPVPEAMQSEMASESSQAWDMTPVGAVHMADAGERLRVGLLEPEELGGPVVGVEHAAGAGTPFLLVEAGAELVDLFDRAVVAPVEDRCDAVRRVRRVRRGCARSRRCRLPATCDVAHLVADLIDDRFGQATELDGVEGGAAVESGFDFIRNLSVAMLDRAASGVVEDGAGGRGADVDREHERRCGIDWQH